MHTIYKISDCQIIGPYTLSLKFDDGAVQIINFKNILKGELYNKLNDLNFFNKVKIDDEIKTIVWPNGADFDPATLHDWHLYENAFQKLVNSWE